MAFRWLVRGEEQAVHRTVTCGEKSFPIVLWWPSAVCLLPSGWVLGSMTISGECVVVTKGSSNPLIILTHLVQSCM